MGISIIAIGAVALLGAIASGRVRAQGTVAGAPGGLAATTDFFTPWLAPFSFAVGFYALALCAFLAATYLAVETEGDPALQRDFRARALGAGVVVGACALLALLLSDWGAPLIHQGLMRRWWTWPFHAGTAVTAVAALWALWRSWFRAARILAAAQTVAILAGWTASQYPYLVVPDFTIWNAAAPAETRTWLLVFLAAGVPILLPSLIVLFRVFKANARTPSAAPENPSGGSH